MFRPLQTPPNDGHTKREEVKTFEAAYINIYLIFLGVLCLRVSAQLAGVLRDPSYFLPPDVDALGEWLVVCM